MTVRYTNKAGESFCGETPEEVFRLVKLIEGRHDLVVAVDESVKPLHQVEP